MLHLASLPSLYIKDVANKNLTIVHPRCSNIKFPSCIHPALLYAFPVEVHQAYRSRVVSMGITRRKVTFYLLRVHEKSAAIFPFESKRLGRNVKLSEFSGRLVTSALDGG